MTHAKFQILILQQLIICANSAERRRSVHVHHLCCPMQCYKSSILEQGFRMEDTKQKTEREGHTLNWMTLTYWQEVECIGMRLHSKTIEITSSHNRAQTPLFIQPAPTIYSSNYWEALCTNILTSYKIADIHGWIQKISQKKHRSPQSRETERQREVFSSTKSMIIKGTSITDENLPLLWDTIWPLLALEWGGFGGWLSSD